MKIKSYKVTLLDEREEDLFSTGLGIYRYQDKDNPLSQVNLYVDRNGRKIYVKDTTRKNPWEKRLYKNSQGYAYTNFNLYDRQLTIIAHRLVAKVFDAKRQLGVPENWDPVTRSENEEKSKYHVHHINRNEQDNNIDNLIVMNGKDHMFWHKKDPEMNGDFTREVALRLERIARETGLDKRTSDWYLKLKPEQIENQDDESNKEIPHLIIKVIEGTFGTNKEGKEAFKKDREFEIEAIDVTNAKKELESKYKKIKMFKDKNRVIIAYVEKH